MLKLLKANQIDFPEFYAEYAIEDLGVFMDKLPMNFMPKMEADMLARGMVHPIIVFSPYEEWQRHPNPELPVNTRAKKEILRVYMGHKRIYVAKKLSYTHISAYHVRTDKDARFLCAETTIREFCPN
jgi:hypothetical protein